MCIYSFVCVCQFMRVEVSKYVGAVRTNILCHYHKTKGEKGVKATSMLLFHPHQYLLYAAHTHTNTHILLIDTPTYCQGFSWASDQRQEPGA